MRKVYFNEFSLDEMCDALSSSVIQKILPLLPTSVPKAEYITRKEAASKLKISLVTLGNWTKRGVIKGYRVGSRVRYKSNEIDQAIKEIATLKYRRS